MTIKERELVKVLSFYGEPTNICITESLLTFDLKKPKGGANMETVVNIQYVIINHFPEYKYIHKMVNDETHFWTVLITDKTKIS